MGFGSSIGLGPLSEGRTSRCPAGRWNAEFLEAGMQGLLADRSEPSTREQQLESEIVDLTQALVEAAVEIRVWKSAQGPAAPSS